MAPTDAVLVDPITLAILKGRLEQIADEMDAATGLSIRAGSTNPDHG